MLLPIGTDSLAVRLTTSENVFNDGSYPEFDGHYADVVSAEMVIIPEPATLLLLCVGSLGVDASTPLDRVAASSMSHH